MKIDLTGSAQVQELQSLRGTLFGTGFERSGVCILLFVGLRKHTNLIQQCQLFQVDTKLNKINTEWTKLDPKGRPSMQCL